MKFFKYAVIASAVVASGAATAALDGTLGLTSQGEADVILIKQNAVQISNVNDINLGTHATLGADATGQDDVCVFNSTSTYSINFTSANGGFNLDDGAGNALPYVVEFGTAAPLGVVTYNTDITGLTGDNTALDCGGATNATFAVTVAAADFNAAAPGTYQDTLIMLVSPE